MASSSRSGSSSYASSALSGSRAYGHAHVSPIDSTFTPTSAVSTVTSVSSDSQAPLGPLDLGPPGYHATIKLGEHTPNETTIYLGPWELCGTDARRVVWRGSYQGETLEHFLPSDNPSEVLPFTLHSQHRRFGDPREMELYLTFTEPHRVRYTTASGVLLDDFVDIKYEFTTIESSIQFQSDIRRRDLVDWFDVDVVWSDQHRRQDSYGAVRGLGTIQRVKIWRDQYSSCHFITFYANHQRRWKEYLVQDFEAEPRNRDDKHRRLQINVRAGRRGSGESHSSGRDRRFSASALFRSRGGSSSSNSNSHGGSSTGGSSGGRAGLDIRHLGFQFSRLGRNRTASDDYVRFFDQWNFVQNSDADFDVPFPTNYIELPSPHMNIDGGIAELPSAEAYAAGGLPVVQEPGDMDAEATP